MKKFQTKKYASSIEAGTVLTKDVIMNVAHQISTHSVLHNKKSVLMSLEASEQVDQERVPGLCGQFKYAFFDHQRLDLVTS